MELVLPSDAVIVFDLDDTLYPEYEFLYSGYKDVFSYIKQIVGLDFFEEAINLYHSGCPNLFFYLINKYQLDRYGITNEELIYRYRFHIPKIKLYSDAAIFINKLVQNGNKISLVTDGRSVTQRNKLKALKIENNFKCIVISEEIGSEKPSVENFKIVQASHGSNSYVYIADNPNKDFIAPNMLNWVSVCLLDRGRNIHKQNFKNLEHQQLPNYYINSFDQIKIGI